MTRYEDIPAINWSSLKHMATSPKLYKWRQTHPLTERKPQFVLGGLTHCALLEPDKLVERYGVYDRVRNGKDWDKWQVDNPGVESLKLHELEHAWSVAIAVRADRHADALLRGGRREEAITWIDEATRLPCKGRLDYLRPDFVVDLKTSYDPKPRRFEIDAWNHGYAAQLAFYHDGAVARRLIDGRHCPWIIAAQTDDAFDVVCFQLKPETLELGRAHYRSLLHRLIECTEADYWPGMAPEPVQLGVPPWAEAQLFGNSNNDEEW